MPSLSTLERACPPSRRRSCQACTKSKRRCDNCLPSCLRCMRRGIVCCYPVSSRVYSSSGRATTEYTFQPLPDCELVLDMTHGMADFNSLSLDMPPMLPMVPTPTSLLPMVSRMPEYLSLESSTVEAPSQIGRNIASHLRYAIEIISQVPSQLVLHNRLPWCHPRFYEIQNQSQNQMPRSMQDAFSSCALYLAKNTTNAQVICQCINARLDDLLQSFLFDTTSTLVDLVAYTQAILLYNIIAIFDADMDARRVVEKTRDFLHASAQQLEFVFTPALKQPGQTDTWDDWIVAETARRTALIAHFFIHMYYHIIVGTPTSVCRGRQIEEEIKGRGKDEKYWTVSPQLWEAASASEFAAARGHAHVVRIYHIDEMLAGSTSRAMAADVARDDFSQILVSSVLGIEAYDGWMAGAGVVTR